MRGPGGGSCGIRCCTSASLGTRLAVRKAVSPLQARSRSPCGRCPGICSARACHRECVQTGGRCEWQTVCPTSVLSSVCMARTAIRYRSSRSPTGDVGMRCDFRGVPWSLGSIRLRHDEGTEGPGHGRRSAGAQGRVVLLSVAAAGQGLPVRWPSPTRSPPSSRTVRTAWPPVQSLLPCR